MEIDEIISILKKFFDNNFARQNKNKERSTVLNFNFRGFQSPFKGKLLNSGGFDPTGKGSVGRVHEGLDLRNPIGTPIYSIGPGTVKYVRTDPKGGNTVVIDHPNGYSSYYAHCSVINVLPNEKIDYDTVIAKVGASGNAKGFGHLHIQVWKNGGLIDPTSVIPNVPPYTPFDSKKEKLSLPGAIEEANNWNINDHLNRKNKLT